MTTKSVGIRKIAVKLLSGRCGILKELQYPVNSFPYVLLTN